MKKVIKKIPIILNDVFLIILSVFLSFLIKNDGKITLILNYIMSYALVVALVKFSVFYLLGLNKSLWRYASVYDLIRIVVIVLFSNLLSLVAVIIFLDSYSLAVFVLNAMIDLFLIGGGRLSFRILNGTNLLQNTRKSNVKRVLVIGAGSAGAMVVKEFTEHENSKFKAVALIDDDIEKQGRLIHGVKVFGGSELIERLCKQKHIDEIIIAMPSAKKEHVSKIIDICKKTKLKLKIVPGVYQFISGRIELNQIRDVLIEDVLGRNEVDIETDEIQKNIIGKTIAISGAAGTIGSELAKQIASYKPKKLILFDVNENALHELEHNLNDVFNGERKNLDFEVLIATVKDIERLEEIFQEYKPSLVFHAAAHKHVPMMEKSPKEAIKNNVFGTLNLVKTSVKYKVDRFLLISTDKAVNPCNIMGASKRMCEMIVQCYDKCSETEFMAVRFGNVLGSNGSVIPLFREQIKKGGPLTVTDPNVIRYFMTISEAVKLVLQAGAIAKGGEIFILDMGEPVKILDLAIDMIKLSNLVPFEDIDIEITGLRPGEKLYEELLMDEEGKLETKHYKIFIANAMDIKMKELEDKIESLKSVIDKDKSIDELKATLKTVVPTYVEPSN